MLHRMEQDTIKDFVTAGNAILTLESGETNARYTYKITKAENKDLWFVSLLTGPDNDSCYSYLCYFTDVKHVKFSAKSIYNYDATPSKAFVFFMNHLDRIPSKLHVYHSCKCGRCGRTLTTPESIKRGLGPECERLVFA